MHLNQLDRWRTVLVIYVLFGLVACFLGFENHGYISMEGMVEDAASHMLSSGDWLIPFIYDEMYTYKPPLVYWLAAIPVALSDGPPPVWLFRLPFVLLGFLLGAGLLVIVGRALGPRTGLFCAVAAVGSALFVEKVRLAEFDAPLTVFTGLGVALAIWALTREAAGVVPWIGAYSFLYLGFLSKGAPALMAFGPGLLVAAVLTGRFGRLFRWQHLLPATYFVSLLAVFFATVVDAAGWAAFTQPADEAAVRGLRWGGYELARAALKPLLILVAFFPFSLLLPRAIDVARSAGPRSRRLWMRASLGFLAGGGAAFVAVPTHEMRYFLPLAAAAGIAFGIALADLAAARDLTRPEIAGHRALIGLLVISAPLSLLVHSSTTALLALAAVVVVWRILERLVPAPALRLTCAVVAFSIVLTTWQALVSIPRRAVKRDLVQVARHFERLIPEDQPVCTIGPADRAGKHSSLFTSLDREVYVLNDSNEGRSHEWCVLVDGDWSLAEGLGLSLVSEVDHPYHHYQLGADADALLRLSAVRRAEASSY